MHYYGFHIKDYRARTAHLTPLEHYIYRTLIDWYYLNEKPFSSVEEIARYLLLPLTDENTQAINNVLDEFFNHHKGKYHHTRINQEIKNLKAGKYTLDNNTTANANQKKGNGAGNETVTESHEASNGKSHAEITPSHETDNGKSHANGHAKPLSDKQRQARYKERKKMVKALSDKGLTVDSNASFDDIVALYHANFSQTVTQNHGKNDAITINH